MRHWNHMYRRQCLYETENITSSQPINWQLLAKLYQTTTTYSTDYRALGPELIPVYGPTGNFLVTPPPVGCHYFPPVLWSHSQLYCLVTEAHRVNLPKVVTQLCPGGNWTHDILTASASSCTVNKTRKVNDWRQLQTYTQRTRIIQPIRL